MKTQHRAHSDVAGQAPCLSWKCVRGEGAYCGARSRQLAGADAGMPML